MYGPPPAPPPGVLSLLFNPKFRGESLTLRLAEIAYTIIMVFTAMTVALFMLWAALLPDWFGWLIKVAMVIGTPVAGLIWLAMVRVSIECITVVFAINDKLSILVHYSEKEAISRERPENSG